jgi:hypothetical protein
MYVPDRSAATLVFKYVQALICREGHTDLHEHSVLLLQKPWQCNQ